MSTVTIRPAVPGDEETILSFIRALADYEHMSDQVVATPELLREWIFEKKKAEVLFAVEDGKGNILPKIKISENVGKITTPHFKKVYRLRGRDTGKAEADLICVWDETVDDTKPLEIFDPEYTCRRTDTALNMVAVGAAALVITLAVQGPGYDALGIEKDSLTESISVPLQQLAATLCEDRPITAEQGEVLFSILPHFEGVMLLIWFGIAAGLGTVGFMRFRKASL